MNHPQYSFGVRAEKWSSPSRNYNDVQKPWLSYSPDDLRTVVRFLARQKTFLASYTSRYKHFTETHRVSNSIDSGIFSLRIKRPWREAEHSVLSRVEAKNTWNYIVFFPRTPLRYNQAQGHFSYTVWDLRLKETSPDLNADGQIVGWLVLKTEQT